MTRVGVLAIAAAVAASACAFGHGTPYPAVPQRERFQHWRVVEVRTGRTVGHSTTRHEYGGGRRGYVLGLRLGSGQATFGGVDSDAAVDVDVYAEYVHSLRPSFALAAGVAWDPAVASFDDGELVMNAIPAYAKALWHPMVPFIVHAGAAVDRHTLTWRVDDMDEASATGTGLHWFVGGGMTWFVGGIGVLFQVEWRHRVYGDVELGPRAGDLSHEALMYQALVAW